MSDPDHQIPPADPLPAVRIVAVDIPFGEVVGLMIKWGIAAVPAAIILGVIWLIVVLFGTALMKVPG